MKYRYLGSSGLLVSRISLGTMTFGAPDWGCNETEAHAIMKKYLDAGGNHIDCADVYAGGRSEDIIGSFLPQINRDEVVVASKCYFPMGEKPNRFGFSRKHIMASCEASLTRLKTDYIDLYYIHGPDPITPYEESMRALEDLVRQGKVRYIGCSNLFGWQIAKAAGVAKSINLEGLVAGQYIYSLVHRELEREVIPSAIDSGLGLMCYSPLGGGLLTGKYKGQSEPAAGTRISFRKQLDGPRFWHPKGFKVADLLDQVSSETSIPMHKLAIAWPLRHRFVTSVIIGVRTAEQLDANMEMGDWDMPDDIWVRLEKQTKPEDDYLTWFNRQNYSRMFSAGEFYDETKALL